MPTYSDPKIDGGDILIVDDEIDNLAVKESKTVYGND